MKKLFFGLVVILLFDCYYTKAQIITTIAGNGTNGVSGDGTPATAATVLSFGCIAVDANSNLYIGCNGNVSMGHPACKVRKVNAAGIINTFAGMDTVGFSGDNGPATAARLENVFGFAFDKKGNVYIADNVRVRKVDTNGIITTFAGNGSMTPSGDGGPATAAGLGTCGGICIDTIGNIYILADFRVRKVDISGIITTFAGTGSTTSGGDNGPATAAGMNAAGQITIDRHGNMYITDYNNRIRKINTAGIITTVAGIGTMGYTGDGGLATAAQLYHPGGVFTDNCDNLYISDSWNNVVRVVNGSGIIKTFAGNGFGAGGYITGSYGGDNGPATAAELNWQGTVYLDNNGSIYIGDLINHRVRYIHMTGCVNTTDVPEVAGRNDGVRLFPNPSQGSFTFSLSASTDEEVRVVITNVVGQKVKEFTTTANKETEIKLNTTPGVYYLSARTPVGKWTTKIMIQ